MAAMASLDHVHPQSSSALQQLEEPRVPTSFSRLQKCRIVWTGIWISWNSNLGSSLPSGAVDAIRTDFSIYSATYLVCLNSLYMLGYTIGPPMFGPLSEHIGRRPVLIATYTSYLIFTMACALSNRFTLLLLFRFLAGLVAAAPNAVVGGLFADIYDNHEERGKAMAAFLLAASMGPPIGPIISGLVERISWRWSFWTGLAVGGIGLPLVLLLPETFAPVLRRRLHASTRAESTPATEPYIKGHHRLATELKVVFARPFSMMFQEPVVLFTSLYLALVYSILYLFFQAYPIIFHGVYEMPPSTSGLAFLPVAAGCIAALGIFLWYEARHAKFKSTGARWTLDDEYRRLPLACIGGPGVVVALFWLGWTSVSIIHPAVPIMSGFCFGAGYLLIFMAMLNYLTDAYKTFSASANAAASTMRSLAAVCLPFAAAPMYMRLGVQWACSLLGFVALLMSSVPFVFIFYGKTLRKRSPFYQKLSAASSDTVSFENQTQISRR